MTPPPEKATIARSAGIMAVATFLSRIMGLLREQIFAYLFGAGAWTDAFNVAFRIPNLLRDLFAEGAMSAAFVPTFNAALKQEGKDRAFQLTNLTLSTLLVLISAICAVGIYFSPEIVSGLAPDFKTTPEKFQTTVLMTRVMFPFLLAISWAAIAMGILNSLNHFFIPAIAPVFLNLAMIVAGFSLCPLAEHFGYRSITGMAVGALIGGFLQMAVQFPTLWKSGFRFQWLWNLKDPGLRRVGTLIVPGTVGLAATQINVAISTNLSTSQGTGSVSWLNFAFRLMQLPLGMFGVAIAQATLPVISRQAADGDKEGMSKTIGSSLKLTAFINIAATAALMALAEPLIRVLFEHGRFTADDTRATTLALQAYAIGLVFFSAIKVLGPTFSAQGETRTPVMASLTSVLANIVLTLLLIGPFSYWGLALGSSMAAGLNTAILYRRLTRKLPDLANQGLFRNISITLAASAVFGLAAHGSLAFFAGKLQGLDLFRIHSLLTDLVSMTMAIFVAGPAMILFAKLVGLSEADEALRMVQKRLFRK